MYRRTTRTLTTTALLCLAMAFPAGNALAQEKQHVSFKASAENSTYPQQLDLGVGDVPNHRVRAFEVHFTYPSDPPVINGLKVVQAWGRGLSDYTDGNGSNIVDNMIVMENGDKIFTRLSGVAWKPKPRTSPPPNKSDTSLVGRESSLDAGDWTNTPATSITTWATS